MNKQKPITRRKVLGQIQIIVVCSMAVGAFMGLGLLRWLSVSYTIEQILP